MESRWIFYSARFEPVVQMSKGFMSFYCFVCKVAKKKKKHSGVGCYFPFSDTIVLVKTYCIKGAAALQGPGDASELLSGASCDIIPL